MKKQKMTEIRIKEFEDELLEAMTRMPYRDITVNQLIQAVGVTRKTFYLHFANKDACLDSLMDRELLAQSAYAASYADNLLAMHLAGCRFWLSRRIFLECILKNDLFTAFLKRMLRHNQTEDREIMQLLCRPLPGSKKDADALLFFTTGYLTVLMSWTARGFDTLPEIMAKKFERLMHTPLLCDTNGFSV